jgi:tRNA G46 methylase TrmB
LKDDNDAWIKFNQERIFSKFEIRGKSLLEIGFGSGFFLKKFAKKLGSKNVAGVEVFDSNISGIKTVKASATKLPFANNSFETVIEKDMLHHVGDENPKKRKELQKKAINEMTRVAKKEAIIIEANDDNFVMKHLINRSIHHHFSPSRLEELLQGKKFEKSFIEAYTFGSNRVFVLKILNYLPQPVSNAILWFAGKIMDLSEGKKSAFMVYKIKP